MNIHCSVDDVLLDADCNKLDDEGDGAIFNDEEMVGDDDGPEVVECWVDGLGDCGEAGGGLVTDGNRDSGGTGDGDTFPVIEGVVALSHGGLELSCVLLYLGVAIDVSDAGGYGQLPLTFRPYGGPLCTYLPL